MTQYSPPPGPPQYQVQQPQNYYQPPAPVARGLAIAALIVGIVAFFTSLIPIFGIIVALAAIALGITALIRRQPKGFAVTGLALGAVALVTAIVAALVVGVFTTAVVETAEEATAVTAAPAPETNGSDTDQQDAVAADQGTRDNPYPLGTTISSADWDVVINSVQLGADDAIAQANTFNQAATPGNQYIVVNATLTYKGADSAFANQVSFSYVDAGGNVSNSYDTVIVPPEPTLTMEELYAGASTTGNEALQIPIDATGVLRVEAGYFVDPVFVALS
ncbi:DUF4190 domain-containing protein [Pseudoclavibacter sp. RFBB5]|uniref:DUF4190 domain-containing protein n=1 Tax=Pseudoclavibacter sp. RFBB5 TaxID=2080574 RepID=UPI0011B0BF5E|nr:DUF4190 domain-containing protein [Pseudoclavibacter sp. RFBB5]